MYALKFHCAVKIIKSVESCKTLSDQPAKSWVMKIWTVPLQTLSPNETM